MSEDSVPFPGLARSPVGCTESSGKEVGPFLAWCAANKIKCPKCCIGHSITTGRCVLARADIAAGEIVISVPDEAVLLAESCSITATLQAAGLTRSASGAAKRAVRQAAGQYSRTFLEEQGLILAVMYERYIGRKSRWAGYLEFMPTDLGHMPLFWEAAELAELRGTAVHPQQADIAEEVEDAATQVNENEVASAWQQLALPVLRSKPKLHKLCNDAGFQLYRWATALVSSYSFVLGDYKFQTMVPYWDMLNHVTDAANVRLHHDAARGLLQMIATKDIVTGQEVVNCFGPALGNAHLLRTYGFVEAHNQFTAAHLPLTVLLDVCKQAVAAQAMSAPPAESIYAASVTAASSGSMDSSSEDEQHTAAIQGHGQHESALCSNATASQAERLAFCMRYDLLPIDKIYLLTAAQPLPATLVETVRLLLISPQAYRRFTKRIDSWKVPKAVPGVPAQPEQLPICLPSVLAQAASQLIQRYPVTLQEDEARVQAGVSQLPPRSQAAIVVRMAELQALHRLRDIANSCDAAQLVAQHSEGVWARLAHAADAQGDDAAGGVYSNGRAIGQHRTKSAKRRRKSHDLAAA